MNITLDELRPVIDAWRWTDEPSTQLALLALGSVMLLAGLWVYLPLMVTWIEVARLDRKLARLAKGTTATRPGRLANWNHAFRNSPVQFHWNELQNRWREQRSDVEQGTMLETASLADVLNRWPLLPRGLRRSVLDSVPGLLMLLGVMGAVLSLSVMLSKSTVPDGGPVMSGLATAVLSAPLWGLTLALVAGLTSRLFHGTFEHYSQSLDRKTSMAWTPFCHENPREAMSRVADPAAELDHDLRGATEVESTHMAHLQLNTLTRQMSSLIEHLHESGFALRNAATALASTQGRIENNSEEIRISLKQAASTVVDQGGFIQMSLDQIRAALDKPELGHQTRRVSGATAASTEITLEGEQELKSEHLPSSAGRRLGPDPYARREAAETQDAKKIERLLEKHPESRSGAQPVPAALPQARSKSVSGKLSDLLARTASRSTAPNQTAAESGATLEQPAAAGTVSASLHPGKTVSAANSNK